MTKKVTAAGSFAFWAIVLLGFSGASEGRAQAAGCSLKSQFYTCDRGQFRPVLAGASTIQVEAAPGDRVAAAKLRDLVAALGKSVAPPDGHADLVFSLVPLPTDGVLIGPAGTELAVLRIYGPARNGARGDLDWAETYFGQADTSWPAVVQLLIQQFRAGFKQ